MKLISYLSKYKLLSFFEDELINSIIIRNIDYFIFEKINEQNIFFKYLNKIYMRCHNLIVYLPDEYLTKIIQISNNEDCDFNIWDLIHNLMLEFENTNHFKLYHIEQQIDIDFYLNLIDSNNFDIVGSIFNIFSICIINFPDFYDEFAMELWEKIMINYNYYPINIKSKAINCLSHLLNPILNLPDDIVCDCRLIDIIINHLYINDFEDTVNLLFILQILIFISIKTDQ